MKTSNEDDYGKELIIDLHNCNPDKFNRKDIRNYLKKLCDLINMERCKLCWWDELYSPEEEKETNPKTAGSSAVQFIKTSNITIHVLDMLHRVYLNIFSCQDFDEKIVTQFSKDWFGGKVIGKRVVRRI